MVMLHVSSTCRQGDGFVIDPTQPESLWFCYMSHVHVGKAMEHVK